MKEGERLLSNPNRFPSSLFQIFAVTVTVYTQSDLIDGIFLLTEGSQNLLKFTTPPKFFFSVCLRIVAGTFGIAATFLLIIYSTEVVELLLNFTAIEFVATLDGSAFDIVSKGFLRTTMAEKPEENFCRKVETQQEQHSSH